MFAFAFTAATAASASFLVASVPGALFFPSLSFYCLPILRLTHPLNYTATAAAAAAATATANAATAAAHPRPHYRRSAMPPNKKKEEE